MKEKKSIKFHSLNAYDEEGNLIGMCPVNFRSRSALAEFVQVFRRGEEIENIQNKSPYNKAILKRVDLSEKDAGQRQAEIIFRSVKGC